MKFKIKNIKKDEYFIIEGESLEDCREKTWKETYKRKRGRVCK